MKVRFAALFVLLAAAVLLVFHNSESPPEVSSPPAVVSQLMLEPDTRCPDLSLLEARRDSLLEQLAAAEAALEAEQLLQQQREGSLVEWSNAIPAALHPQAWESQLHAAISTDLPKGSALYQLQCDEAPCVATVAVPISWGQENGLGIPTSDELLAMLDRITDLEGALKGAGEAMSTSEISIIDGQNVVLISVGVLPDGHQDAHPGMSERLRLRVELENGDAHTATEDALLEVQP